MNNLEVVDIFRKLNSEACSNMATQRSGKFYKELAEREQAPIVDLIEKLQAENEMLKANAREIFLAGREEADHNGGYEYHSLEDYLLKTKAS